MFIPLLVTSLILRETLDGSFNLLIMEDTDYNLILVSQSPSLIPAFVRQVVSIILFPQRESLIHSFLSRLRLQMPHERLHRDEKRGLNNVLLL